MNHSPLVLFHRGRGTDHAGRLITHIHQFDFRELERTHDYIQWLFPLVTRSNFNDHAPLLAEEDRAEFHRDPVVRRNFRTSLELMWAFYGFRISENGSLGRTERWAERRDNWLTRDNHNLLRITRILRSSMLCGFTSEAQSFFAALMVAVNELPAIADDGPGFWKAAVETVPIPPKRTGDGNRLS